MKAKSFALLLACTFVAALALLVCCLRLMERLAYAPQTAADRDAGILDYGLPEPDFYVERLSYLEGRRGAYDALVFGGSKAGGLRTQTLDALTGRRFYNFWISSATFEDYEFYLAHFLREWDLEGGELVLHLSSHTVERAESRHDNRLAAGGSLFFRAAGWFVRYTNIQRFFIMWGLLHEGKTRTLTCPGGERNFAEAKEEFRLDPSGYVADHVLDYWGGYGDCLEKLFVGNADETVVACEANLAALRRIKQKCADSGVTLTVVVGPTFVGELHKYASEKYIRYMKEFVSVCPVWNFSGINGVNLNPFNFHDGGHFFDFVGDAMMRTVYAGGRANTSDFGAFGVLLGPDNIDAYIDFQRGRWNALKSEWEAAGSVTLGGMDSEGYLGNAAH